MNKEQIDNLSDVIRKASLSLHSYLKHGHLEKVYENGLKHRLELQGLKVSQQIPMTVKDRDGFVLGEFIADLLVEDTLIIELKATRAINDSHVSQLLGYLRATNTEYGLLINFGSPKFSIKRYILN